MPVVELEFDASGALIGAKEFSTATDKVSKDTDKTASALSKMATSARVSLNAVGVYAGAFAGVVGVAMAGVIKKSVEMASDMQETQSKFNVVFTGMEQKAEGWAQVLNESYNMSREEAKRFTSDLAALLQPMGFAKEKAGELSFSMAKLAADMGSFHNANAVDVMEALTAALSGEYEMMKRYGVLLNAARVEQEAFIITQKTKTAELTYAEKAQAAYNIILRDTALAQGDVARNVDTYAYQLRETQKLMADITTQLGQLFLPAATQLLTILNDWITTEGNLNSMIMGTVEVIRFMYNGFMGIVLAAKGVVTAVAFMAENVLKYLTIVIRPVENIAFKLGLIETTFANDLVKAAGEFKDAAAKSFDKTLEGIIDVNQGFDNFKTKVDEAKNGFDVLKDAGETATNAISGGADKAEDSFKKLTAAQAEQYALTMTMADNEKAALNGVVLSAEQLKAKYDEYYKAVVKTTAAVVTGNSAIDQSKNSMNGAAAAAGNLAGNLNNIASAYDKVSNTAKKAAASTGSGSSAGGSGTGSGPFDEKPLWQGKSNTGSTTFPSWFTTGMIAKYNQEMRRYMTDQSYIWDTDISKYGPGGSPSGYMPSTNLSPGDPSAWAERQGYSDARVTTDKSVSAGSVNVYVNQNMSPDELATLVTNIERMEERQ